MSTPLRDRAERPLSGVQILQVTPLPVEGDGTVPRSRGAVFFCLRSIHRTVIGEGAFGWPC